MTIPFVKYQGTGNDFVLIDNRAGAWQDYLAMQVPQHFASERELVAHICHRQFGVGADGLMLLQNKEGFHFERNRCDFGHPTGRIKRGNSQTIRLLCR